MTYLFVKAGGDWFSRGASAYSTVQSETIIGAMAAPVAGEGGQRARLPSIGIGCVEEREAEGATREAVVVQGNRR